MSRHVTSSDILLYAENRVMYKVEKSFRLIEDISENNTVGFTRYFCSIRIVYCRVFQFTEKFIRQNRKMCFISERLKMTTRRGYVPIKIVENGDGISINVCTKEFPRIHYLLTFYLLNQLAYCLVIQKPITKQHLLLLLPLLQVIP